ncbi:MAG: hypothetical protein OEX00_10030 [Gammaproteobacteria bacterium]|nr:hypothetical protein [Gammaproteobacteria bacterium]MDH5694518.1 hypothetical protein [Gammaproteobacteria bacterium]
MTETQKNSHEDPVTKGFKTFLAEAMSGYLGKVVLPFILGTTVVSTATSFSANIDDEQLKLVIDQAIEQMKPKIAVTETGESDNKIDKLTQQLANLQRDIQALSDQRVELATVQRQLSNIEKETALLNKSVELKTANIRYVSEQLKLVEFKLDKQSKDQALPAFADQTAAD